MPALKRLTTGCGSPITFDLSSIEDERRAIGAPAAASTAELIR
jgi:hypothetical protein